jgi:ATP-dependent helicase HrpB
MTRLPLPARLARVVVAAEQLGVAQSGALAVALLSVPDIREHDPRRDTESGESDVQERMDALREAEDSECSGHILGALGLRRAQVQEARRAFAALGRKLPDDEATKEAAEAQLRRALLAGFADCVARRQAPGSDKLILCSGTRAKLATGSVVHQSGLLLALDVEERGASGARGPERSPATTIQVRWASAIDPDWLLSDQSAWVEPREELVWNPDGQRVDCLSKLAYGSVTLDESRGRAPPSEEASRLLFEKLAPGLRKSESLVALRERLGLLAEYGLSTAKMPDDDALLLEACAGRVSAAEIDAERLGALLLEGLDAETRQMLFRETPESMRLPQGRALKIHYEAGKPPWVASRLQDFFGMKVTPTLCRGRQPLVLHLLAPNQRAVQVTTDLEGFWQRHYPELRKQLGRRYPKHSWPQDGATATPPAPRPPRRP